jgi:hypothetical protein
MQGEGKLQHLRDIKITTSRNMVLTKHVDAGCHAQDMGKTQ